MGKHAVKIGRTLAEITIRELRQLWCQAMLANAVRCPVPNKFVNEHTCFKVSLETCKGPTPSASEWLSTTLCFNRIFWKIITREIFWWKQSSLQNLHDVGHNVPNCIVSKWFHHDSVPKQKHQWFAKKWWAFLASTWKAIDPCLMSLVDLDTVYVPSNRNCNLRLVDHQFLVEWQMGNFWPIFLTPLACFCWRVMYPRKKLWMIFRIPQVG